MGDDEPTFYCFSVK